MSKLARISRAALRNPPSRSRCRFLNKHEKLVSSTTTYVVGLPTDWLKKSNLWHVVVPASLNPNGINHRPPFFIPCSLFSTTTSNYKEYCGTSHGRKDDDDHRLHYRKATSNYKECGTSNGKDDDDDDDDLHYKKVYKEKIKIFRVLLDYDDPHNHLIDGVKVLSNVLKTWNKFRPNFELDYVVGDLETPQILFRLSQYLKVDQKATSKEISMAKQKILMLLKGYDDPEFADQVLLMVLEHWRIFADLIETRCIDAWITNKDKHDEEVNYPFPSSVVGMVRHHKMMMDNFDDPDAILEELDAQIKKEKRKLEMLENLSRASYALLVASISYLCFCFFFRSS